MKKFLGNYVKKFISYRKIVAIFCVISMIATIGMPAMITTSAVETALQVPSYSGTYADAYADGQIHIVCGDTEFLSEDYLVNAGDSFSKKLQSTWMLTMMSRTLAAGGIGFEYSIPIEDMETEPSYLSMVTYGEIKISVNGTVVYNGLNSADTTGFTPREFPLNTDAIKDAGSLNILFENVSDSGEEAGVLWFEVGATSLWRNRVRHILWDVEAIEWQIGYYDGTSNEFIGGNNALSVTDDFTKINTTGTVTLTWNQSTINNDSQYYLLTGIIGGEINAIDVGDDGSYELNRNGNSEVVYDLEITDKISMGKNCVRIDNSGELDFVALVEVKDGAVSDEEVRVVFKGNEMSENWTKLANNTMYWNNDIYVEESTGFVDASSPNGIFSGGYWVADAAPTAIELAKWGYYQDAKQVTMFYPEALMYCIPAEYPEYGNSGGYCDNGSVALIISAMVQVMRSENFAGDYSVRAYNSLKTAIEYFCEKIDDSADIGLIRGNNPESTNGEYAIANNTNAYYAILNAVFAAEEMGKTEDAKKWESYAKRLKFAITKELLLEKDTVFAGVTLPSGTFRYAISDFDTDVTGAPHAGWFAAGSNEDLYYGYLGNAIPEWRSAIDKMLSYHSSNFWKDWALYGHNRGFGTDYGVLSERGGWPLSAMFMSDQMSMAQKNLEHLIYNSVDINFEHDNEGFAEISPWVLTREIAKYDTGIKNADVGNGFEIEDMNLVEYIVPLKNVRIMAGINDSIAEGTLKIIPRIPSTWSGVEVNSWPVTYKTSNGNYDNAKISYDYSLSPEKATMDIFAEKNIENVEVRFGPFDITAEDFTATVNGKKAKVTTEISGDSKWAYVTVDVNSANTHIEVNSTIPSMVEYQDFSEGISALNVVEGLAKAEDGRFELASNGVTAKAISKTVLKNKNGVVYSADVEMNAKGESGLLIGTDKNGNGGYRITLTSNTGDTEAEFGSIAVVNNTTNEDMLRRTLNVNQGRAYNIKVVILDGSLSLYLNGTCIGSSFGNIDNGYYGFITTSVATFDILNISNSASSEMLDSISKIESKIDGKTEINTITGTTFELSTSATLVSGAVNDNVVTEIKLDSTDGVSIDYAKNSVTFEKTGKFTLWTEVTVDGEVIKSNEIKVDVRSALSNNELLNKNFDNNILGGTANGGTWYAENGIAKVESTGDAWYSFNATGSNYVYSADITLVNGNAVGISFRSSGNPSGNGYDVIFDIVDNCVKLCQRPYAVIKSVPFSVKHNNAYHLDVVANSGLISVYVDGHLLFEDVNTLYTTGNVSLFSFMSTATFDNVKLYELGAADTELKISADSSIVTGKTGKLSVVLTDSNGSVDITNSLDLYEIEYIISNPNVITVEGNSILAFRDGSSSIMAVLKTTDGYEVVSNVINIDSGNLAYKETFDGMQIPNGWTTVAGEWNVAGGKLNAVSGGDMWVLDTNSGKFTDVKLSADVITTGTSIGLAFRTSTDTGSVIGYDIEFDRWNGLQLSKRTPGWQQLALVPSYKNEWSDGKKYQLDVEMTGSNIKIWVDGVLAIDYVDNSPITDGYNGVFAYSAGAVEEYKINNSSSFKFEISPKTDELFTGALVEVVSNYTKNGVAVDNINDFEVKYYVKDENIAKVESGKLIALKEGTTSIYAVITDNGEEMLSNKVDITICDIKGFVMDLPKNRIELNSSTKVNTKLLLKNGNEITDLSVYSDLSFDFALSNEKSVKLENNVITGVSRGISDISAILVDNTNSKIVAESDKVRIYVYDSEDAEVFFAEDFSSDNAIANWDKLSGNWTVKNGKLNISSEGDAHTLITDWGKISNRNFKYSGYVTTGGSAGLSFLAQPDGNGGIQGYFVGLFSWGAMLAKSTPGHQHFETIDTFRAEAGRTYYMEIEVTGAIVNVWVDGEHLYRYVDVAPISEGYVGVFANWQGSADNLTLSEAYVPVEQIMINTPTDKQVLNGVGDTIKLDAFAYPYNALNSDVEWEIVSGSATIDENGLLTATGTKDITVKVTSKDVAGCSDTIIIRNSDSFKGDYNGDGKVDVVDLVRLKKYFAGIDVDIAIENDIDDGIITTSDLVKLRKLLLGAEI